MNKKLLTNGSIGDEMWNALSDAGLVIARNEKNRLELLVLRQFQDRFIAKLTHILGLSELDATILITWVDGNREDYMPEDD